MGRFDNSITRKKKRNRNISNYYIFHHNKVDILVIHSQFDSVAWVIKNKNCTQVISLISYNWLQTYMS
jgi:hypothetical protein